MGYDQHYVTEFDLSSKQISATYDILPMEMDRIAR